MRLEVVRKWFTPESTGGELYLDGRFQCFTLEPPSRPEKPCAIPEGEYPVTIRHSPRFGRDLPHVEHVPGFEGILIHPGNAPEDTHGCLLVGNSRAENRVFASRAALATLFALLCAARAEHNTIVYTHAAAVSEPKSPPIVGLSAPQERELDHGK